MVRFNSNGKMIIEAGDTLSSIANQLGLTGDERTEFFNFIQPQLQSGDINLIQVGEKLNLGTFSAPGDPISPGPLDPDGNPFDPTAPLPPPPEFPRSDDPFAQIPGDGSTPPISVDPIAPFEERSPTQTLFTGTFEDAQAQVQAMLEGLGFRKGFLLGQNRIDRLAQRLVDSRESLDAMRSRIIATDNYQQLISDGLVPDPNLPGVPDPGDPVGGGGGGSSFNFFEAASLLLPFLPPELVRIYADAWADFGDRTIALEATRADPRYEQFFPGIKRGDGTLRMTEQEYLATKEAYRISLLELDVNPNLFDGKFVDLISNNVSAREFALRLDSAFRGIINNIPEVQAFYANNFGINMTESAVFASVLDPEIGQSIINQNISIAQVGGEAALQGFAIGGGFAEELANAGLAQNQARALFADAAFRLPTLATLADRFNAPDSTFDLSEFVDASFLGDASQARRINRLRAGESSSFSSQDFASTTQQGLVSGIEER